MANVKKVHPNSFQLCHPFWIVILTLSMYCLMMATYAPLSVPEFLGPLGRFVTQFGLKFPNVCIYLIMFLVIAHVFEGAYTVKICRDLKLNKGATTKWTVQTLLFGIASLSQLLKLRSHHKND